MGSAIGWTLGTLATLAFVGFVFLLVRGGAQPYRAERALAVRLAQDGRPAGAEVLRLDRQPGGDDLFAVPMKLAVRYADATGGKRYTDLHVYIDKELLANFMPGRTVHVRYDPEDPGRVAVDRALTPTEIPAEWRRAAP